MAQYQKFDLPNISHLISARIVALRAEIKKHALDGYLVPHTDEFQGEYIPEHAQRLSYISGFTGSWGLSLILSDQADLYVDSRYKLQAPEQTDANIFDIICVSDLPLLKRIKQINIKGKKIGFDPLLFTKQQIKRYQKASDAKFIAVNDNLVDKARSHLPQQQQSNIAIHPSCCAGKSSVEKIDDILGIMKKDEVDALIVSLPEAVCWLLNVRGNDVPHTPFVLARGVLTADKKFFWYVGQERISEELKSHLPDTVIVKEEEDFWVDIMLLKEKNVISDPANTSYRLSEMLEEVNVNLIKEADPILLAKAIKNKTEQQATKDAHVRDAFAMIKFSQWYEEQIGGEFTEIDCVNALENFRSEAPELKDISFDTISGAGENGAIVHYRVTNESNRIIQKDDLFLCDSGGQYYDGTTDITRCFIIDKPTKEMKKRYTQVLKGHLALASAIFPKGTTGSSLDILARKPLWDAGIDYGHGTGHGVGLYLSVHEGPQSISSRSTVKLEEGMLISNEPGYYKEGEYGIRIENVEMIVTKGIPENGEKEMLGFETITLVPYERKLIEISLLTDDEINQIDNYHQKIYEKISNNCSENLKKYLFDKCKRLKHDMR